MIKINPEKAAFEERCKNEAKEQEEMQKQALADSKAHDEAMSANRDGPAPARPSSGTKAG